MLKICLLCYRFLLLLLYVVDITTAKVKRVPDQLLAVKTGHHAVHESFFVAQKLAEDGAELQMILAEVAKFE